MKGYEITHQCRHWLIKFFVLYVYSYPSNYPTDTNLHQSQKLPLFYVFGYSNLVAFFDA